jgi:hypothetical protein
MRIQYTDRLGRKHDAACNDFASAAARLVELDAIEAETRKCAPTDSGDVRFNYRAEATAIRTAMLMVPA